MAATVAELQPLLTHFKATATSTPSGMQCFTIITPHCHITVCITGAGILQTAYHVNNYLHTQNYHWAIAAGIAGSFTRRLDIGDVVEVHKQQIADLGAEDHKQFIPIEQMPFYNPNHFPYTNGCLYNQHTSDFPLLPYPIPRVNGITVNTVSGRTSTIQLRKKLYNPDIECMEGAAFFYTCQMHGIGFTEIRAISNYVEPRNPKLWNIPLAINNLCAFLTEWVLLWESSGRL